jgi:diguanylate cyclase (GGDEF)-like protein/PAS domain S-box-containing protein
MDVAQESRRARQGVGPAAIRPPAASVYTVLPEASTVRPNSDILPDRDIVPAAAPVPIALGPDEASRRRSEASLLILEAAGEGIYGIDRNGLTTFANPAAEALTGWNAGELIGKPQHATIHHSHADGTNYAVESCPIYGALHDGVVHHCDTEVFWRKDGTSFPVAYTSTPILRDGRPDGAVVVFQDVTRRKRREAWELEKSAVFAAITSHQDLDTTLAMITAAAVQLLPEYAIAMQRQSGSGLRLAAQGGVPDDLRLLLANVLAADPAMACARAAASGATVTCTRSPDSTCTCRELDESTFSHLIAIPLLSAGGRVLGVVTFLSRHAEGGKAGQQLAVNGVCDLARLAIEHQLLHAELLRQSQHDHLTGLPNRLLFEDRLSRALVNARRHATLLAVCHLDLDHFKQINETLGHHEGDFVLRHVATLLRDILKEIDTVARQSGDEFILILSDLKSEVEADAICERILTTLRVPFEAGHQTLTLAASIGRSMYPANGDSVNALLQEADLALYAAKYCGGNRLQSFNETLGERIQKDIELQWELRSALEREQLHVVYQPLFNTLGRLVGFEALLRWIHPRLGTISPDVFIPIAEKTGIIVSIGEWVLMTACREAKGWNTSPASPVRISVNVSAVQLGQPEFTAVIARALEETGLPAELLDLEITETSLVADAGSASRRLRELRTMGIHISMDDFGCGHSSFSNLQNLPIDTIKIDRSFIAPLDGTEKKSAIIRTIFALAQQLGLKTVAEGVETMAQMEELQTTDCSLVQGFLLSRPLAAEAARLLVVEGGVSPTRKAVGVSTV